MSVNRAPTEPPTEGARRASSALRVIARESAPRARPAWRRYAIALVVWTLAGIVLVEQSHTLGGAPPGHYRDFLLETMAGMWLWALFTPPIMDLGRRWPLEPGRWAANLPKHAVATLAFAAVDALVMYPIRLHFGEAAGYTLFDQFRRGLFACEASYVVIIALATTSRYASMYQERRAAAAELEAELAGARLTALNAQLRPHFHFNTLNAIAELLHSDPARADRLLLSLAVLLRRSFSPGDAQEVPLAEELRFVDEYLAILGARLDDRLHVTIDVPDEVRDAAVPSFLLQPLVENAVRHGIERVPGGGHLVVTVRREADAAGMPRLRVEVRDDGAGLAAPAPRRDGSGLGVRTTRERLRHLYGDAHSFELVDAPPRGTAAVVTLPFRKIDTATERVGARRIEEVA
jgi:hypothetical protein